MQYDVNTPREAREYAGVALMVPMCLPVGHALGTHGADWVNTQISTVTGNAFGGAVRRALAAEDKARAEAHAKAIAEGKNPKAPKPATVNDVLPEGIPSPADWFFSIFDDYDIEEARSRGDGTGVKADPITSLARSLAEADLVAYIVSKGLTAAAFRKVKMDDGRTKFSHLLDDQFNKGPKGTDGQRMGRDEYMARARATHEEAARQASYQDEDDLDLTLDAAA